MVNRMGSEPIHADAPVVEAPAQTEQKPEREKVDITGRIATDPKYSERKAGRRTLKFVLAEHPEPATTNFHKITMWNERADKYNGTLTKGEEVRVVGNLREFTYTDKKTGEKKQGSEIYAWGVGKPKRERPSNSGAERWTKAINKKAPGSLHPRAFRVSYFLFPRNCCFTTSIQPDWISSFTISTSR